MRNAHITDLHLRGHLPGTARITTRLSRRMPGLFREALRRIASEKPDLVVVSGDLLDYPAYAVDDTPMRALATQDLRLIRDALQTLDCPHVVLHGNHDVEELVADVFPDAQNDFACGGFRVVTFADNEVDDHCPQRLTNERERFLAATGDPASPPQIHVQHYLIHPDRSAGYPHNYREAESLREMIAESGRVRLVLCGHYHGGIAPIEDRGTTYAVAPAFCDPPHRYWVYDVDDRSVTHSERTVLDESTPRRRAVFLDRDGTVTVAPFWRSGPKGLALLPGAGEALSRLADAGFVLVIVSNQSAVGAGYVTEAMVAQVNDAMSTMLAPFGVDFDGVYCSYDYSRRVVPGYSSETPDSKPSPIMLQRAAEERHLDLARSFMVGDSAGDIEAGRNAGARTVLVRTGHGERALEEMDPSLADAVAADLARAADWILSRA